MVIEYLAHQLISGYKTNDTDATAFLDHYDFYLVPFHNPDGKTSRPIHPKGQSQLTNPTLQASSTPKPTTASGAKTANPAPPSTQPASAPTATATGPSNGTPSPPQAAPPPTPAAKPTAE